MSIIRQITGSVTVTGDVNITPQDTAVIDAFGRMRVSNPVTLFDSKQIFDDSDLAANVENQPLFYDNQEISGGGTATAYDNNKAQTTLSVSNATAGNRVRQTKLRFNYQPGKSLMVINSFLFGTQYAGITRREGYFDDKNGIFLEDNGTTYRIVIRTYTSGTASDAAAVARASWNIDSMDGNGPSGVNLDFTKTQLFFTDIEWLGVGRVRCGFVVNGLIYYAHEFLNTNSLSSVYMSTPNLPLRSQIINSGTGPAATMIQICSTVISEGGLEPTGIIRCASTDGTHVDANTENIIYAVLGLKKKTNYIGCTLEIIDIDLQLQTASSKIEWMLYMNPTVAGAFTYVDELRSSISVARGATANTVTNGYKLAGGFCESGGVSSGASGSVNSEIHNALRLGSLIDGTRDEIVLCVRPIGGSTNVDVEGSITWRELL